MIDKMIDKGVKTTNDGLQMPSFQHLIMVRPTGIEPVHLAPEASALSPELRARC